MKGLTVAVIVFIFFGLASGEFRIGRTNRRHSCVKNWECRNPMKCIPVIRGARNCRVRTSGGLHACECVMPSRKSQNCNDHDDCAGALRCVGGQCRGIKIRSGNWKESCVSNRECKAPMSCVPVVRGGLGACKCLMPGRAGHNCNDQADCGGQNLRCVRGLCKRKRIAECEWGNYGRDCRKGLTCVGRKCVRRRYKGEKCDVALNCVGHLTCTGGKCVDRRGWYTWFIRDHTSEPSW